MKTTVSLRLIGTDTRPDALNSDNANNRDEVMAHCRAAGMPLDRFNNFFDADSFFGTEYVSGVRKRGLFVIKDHFMTNEIYSVNQIGLNCRVKGKLTIGIKTLTDQEGKTNLTQSEAMALLVRASNEHT